VHQISAVTGLGVAGLLEAIWPRLLEGGGPLDASPLEPAQAAPEDERGRERE
jgi:hypothetical protein